ncbi:MAG: prepilin-type N-terminal cleavage/methylation domain-containing protein [Polyangiaceae bacterium]
MKAKRGYTLIELLIAVTVFAIGVSGVIAMQKVTVAANLHAKELSVATHIAQAWGEQLAADAAAWNHPSPRNAASDIGETRWLVNVTGNAGVWFRPAYDGVLNFGPSFDVLGNVVPDAQLQQAHYCTHIRLSWLYPDNAGNGLLRAEVRVFWLREGMGGTVDGLGICDSNTDPTAVEGASERYHFVHQTTAIKQATAQ